MSPMETMMSVKGKHDPKKTPKPVIYIQSPFGGEITPEEVLDLMPAGTDACYVRVDQNLIWWVREDGETGAVKIWDEGYA